MPAIPSDQLTDQFACTRPCGSTTAALIATTHHISGLLESCSYVRCILIDYSKAFDTINHSILFRKLLKLPKSHPIFYFGFSAFLLTECKPFFSFGQTSTWIPVTHSIIQGSGIGPCLYLIYASDLRTLSPQNVIIKYADDTTLLVAQHSLVDMAQEYNNVCSWSTQNKLLILSKLKKLFFTALLLETLVPVFRLLCQELKELYKQRYLELM